MPGTLFGATQPQTAGTTTAAASATLPSFGLSTATAAGAVPSQPVGGFQFGSVQPSGGFSLGSTGLLNTTSTTAAAAASTVAGGFTFSAVPAVTTANSAATTIAAAGGGFTFGAMPSATTANATGGFTPLLGSTGQTSSSFAAAKPGLFRG